MTMTPWLGERRAWPRRLASESHPFTTVRIRPGGDVGLVDLSSGGVLIETDSRLLPGSRAELHLAAAAACRPVLGRVLRCEVFALDRLGGVRYRAALAFDERVEMPCDRDREQVPRAEYLVPDGCRQGP